MNIRATVLYIYTYIKATGWYKNKSKAPFCWGSHTQGGRLLAMDENTIVFDDPRNDTTGPNDVRKAYILRYVAPPRP